MAKKKRNTFVVPLFIPFKGCPFRCIYCRQEAITGIEDAPPFEEIERILSESISSKRFKEATDREIAFFGGTFTGLGINDMELFLKIANKFIEEGYFNSIRISTRPDYIDYEILDFLKSNNVRTIEIGVQSFDDKVLKATRRGYTKEVVIKTAKAIKERGLRLGIQLMLGLPRETRESFYHGIKDTIALKPDFVRLYPTVVLKGTKLELLYESGEYIPLDFDQAIELASTAISEFEEQGITVIRVGLHNSAELKTQIIAGPYHPSFGDIARSVANLKSAMKYKEDNLQAQERLLIHYKKAHIVYGHKGEAIRIFSKILGARGYRIKKNDHEIEVQFEF